MTEKQVEQLERRNSELRAKYKSLNELIDLLNTVVSQNDGREPGERYSSVRNLFYTIWNYDNECLTDMLIKKANLLIAKEQSELDNISLLTILSEIEKG